MRVNRQKFFRCAKGVGLAVLAAAFGWWILSELNEDGPACPRPEMLAGDLTSTTLPTFKVTDATTGFEITYRYGMEELFEPSLRRDINPLPDDFKACYQDCAWTSEIGLRYSLYGGSVNMLGELHASSKDAGKGRGNILTSAESFYYNAYKGNTNTSYVAARDPRMIGIPIGEATRVLVAEKVMAIVTDCRTGE